MKINGENDEKKINNSVPTNMYKRNIPITKCASVD